MLAWVVEAARACPQLDDVIVATDDLEVEAVCLAQGWRVEMTAADLASGSDRVYAVAKRHPAEIYVNIQGDEPLLRAPHLTSLLTPFADPGVAVTTLKVRCSQENLSNPNAVKVVTDRAGRALYFSRATIPYDRDGVSPAVWKHLGFYAYRAAALERFHALVPGGLEAAERLEQLRFLEHGMAIHVAETGFDTVGVDTEEDLRRVEAILQDRLDPRQSSS
jgi:3-deoxy-manno-octulosonate cytidylyltransferase (CMP-KDO synthetase)